jgi:diguanylate cyclase (GGDEF)-like protein
MDRRKILVVDDVKSNIDILVSLLSEQYDVFGAMNGEKALKMLKRREIDLILLDIVMPDMDGFELSQKIKREPSMKNIPIIFLTAKTDEDSIEKAFDVGGVDYTTKPFRAKEIFSRIKTHIEFNENLKKLEYLAFRDPMTGIFNRRKFFELFKEALSKTSSISVAMVDIDKFKSINDRYGHAFGDEVIKKTTETISNNIPESAIFGRLGGEEFAVVFPQTVLESGVENGERIREKIEALETYFGGECVKFTVSIGVAQLKSEENIDKVLHRADEALYLAKKSGRNRVIPAD